MSGDLSGVSGVSGDLSGEARASTCTRSSFCEAVFITLALFFIESVGIRKSVNPWEWEYANQQFRKSQICLFPLLPQAHKTQPKEGAGIFWGRQALMG